ncbi:MAG TPA: NAD(P)-dependent oxidoreductase [Anaerolineae bacterium]|nr:NAD(P)-dependent oxidoreductase [Anaerolineae bacterium]
MTEKQHVLITGGAGYIGSYLAGKLLLQGYKVTVVDDLLYGGESLLAYLPNKDFRFVKADVWESRALKSAINKQWAKPVAVVHLAGIAGFPACQSVGRQVAWRYNVEATQHGYEQSADLGIDRFIYVSSYSNYILSTEGEIATEETPLNPQSLYAETEIAAERYLLANKDQSIAPLIFRTANLYGLSTRPRFDLIVNQFVYDAYFKHALMIYQRGYLRSFIHIDDLVHGIILGLQAPLERIRGEIYNIGSEKGNLSKDEVITFILKRLPETVVNYKDLTFGGDMRDIRVSFAKIKKEMSFTTKYTVDDGVKEILHALRFQIISSPSDVRYRNAHFIVQ